jgi:uncharacterized protein (DUF2336 family)
MLASDPEAHINEAIAKEKELAETTAAAVAAQAACEEIKKELAADASPEKEAALGPKLAEAEKEATEQQAKADVQDKECEEAIKQACQDTKDHADKCADTTALEEQQAAEAEGLKNGLDKA